MKKIINEKEFNALKDKSSISIVKFGQEGCMPCLIAGETLAELEKQFPQIYFYECEDIDLMQKLGITNLPVIYIITLDKQTKIDAYNCLDDLEETITKLI